MSRERAIESARTYVDDGVFETDLARRVAHRTESQLLPESLPELRRYIDDELVPSFEAMGYETTVIENPVDGAPPAVVAERHESDHRPTVLSYGHGDVIVGQDDRWTKGRGPWELSRDGDRLYGRGTADNKAQHTINMAALRIAADARGGELGFNAKYLVEMGEEAGSAGLDDLVAANQARLSADVLIASDGPRVRADRPTMSLGSRGAVNVDLVVDLRVGAHHSGNWGGLIADPSLLLATALASIVGPSGELLVDELLAVPMSDVVRSCLDDIEVDGGADGPTIDAWWGQPGLTPPQRVFAANTFSVLAMSSGNPNKVVNAIPPRAVAHCQLRMVAGTDPELVAPALRRHLDAHGFEHVSVEPPPGDNDVSFPARRTEPDHPWAVFVRDSIATTMDRPGSTSPGSPAVLPSIGGSVPNHVFTDILDLPTIWIPHSYPSCSQHAPDEHVLIPTCRSAMEVMTGLFWDIGEVGGP